MSKPKLKPCPWCGSEDKIKIVEGVCGFRVLCLNSDCLVQPETKFYNKQLGATNAWNRRKTQ